MRRIALIVMLAGAARIGAAQVVPLIEPGQRVRVHVPGMLPDLQGIVMRVAQDTLVLQSRSGLAPVVMVPSRLTELYLHQGRQSLTFRGAVVGGLLGVVAGGLYGTFAPRSCAERICAVNKRFLGVSPSLGFGLIGMGVGLIAGSFASHDVWVRTWLFPPTGPGEVRLGIGLSW